MTFKQKWFFHPDTKKEEEKYPVCTIKKPPVHANRDRKN